MEGIFRAGKRSWSIKFWGLFWGLSHFIDFNKFCDFSMLHIQFD